MRTAIIEYLQPKTEKPVHDNAVNKEFLDYLKNQNSRFLEIIEQDITQLREQYNRLMTNIEQVRYLKPKEENASELATTTPKEEEVLTQKPINPQKDYDNIKDHINSITLKEEKKKKEGLWGRFIARM